jgi:hypothetical protein
MIAFTNVQRQFPEIWITRRGSVTARETMHRYGLKDEQAAIVMLDTLVRNGKLVKHIVDGVPRWSRRR